MSAGFSWDDNYSDTKWLRGRELVYQVGSGFPSITPRLLPGRGFSMSVTLCHYQPASRSSLQMRLSGLSCPEQLMLDELQEFYQEFFQEVHASADVDAKWAEDAFFERFATIS